MVSQIKSRLTTRNTMLPINDPRIKKTEKGFEATCTCGATYAFASKNGALEMLERGTCRHCKKDYRSVNDAVHKIHQNAAGKWCSFCPVCKKEQEYTRKDHAKQSSVAGWTCRSCTAAAKGFAAGKFENINEAIYSLWKKMAMSRGIRFDLTVDQMFDPFTGFCTLTGWPIKLLRVRGTASLDRIDSSKGYEVGNIQWVHTMVNMSKNKYPQHEFVRMCTAVAKTMGPP